MGRVGRYSHENVLKPKSAFSSAESHHEAGFWAEPNWEVLIDNASSGPNLSEKSKAGSSTGTPDLSATSSTTSWTGG